MWLLNTTTLKLEEFPGKDVPPYAILSHVWGKDEVTFQDVQAGYPKRKAGLAKLQNFCALAKEHHFIYTWMDTCCTDKTSSSELSESMNSTYRWYKMSSVCYVYLEDVRDNDKPTDEDSDFRKSRWFTRGWTLQELIAPLCIFFYSANWKILGSKIQKRPFLGSLHYEKQVGISATLDLRNLLSAIIGISLVVLENSSALQNCSVAQRMSWAASRQTTKPEDIAYYMTVLFDLNMPLLYGEGEEKAFIRLQEEILKVIEDDTLLMHTCPEVQCHHYTHPVLAPSPKGFRGLGNIKKGETGPLFDDRKISSRMTPKGLQVQLPICPCILVDEYIHGADAFIAILDCRVSSFYLNRGVIVLMKQSNGIFARYANLVITQLVFHKQEVALTTKDGSTALKAISIQFNKILMENIYISSSGDPSHYYTKHASILDCTNIVFQTIEQPPGCHIVLQHDNPTTERRWNFLSKKYKLYFFKDENSDDAFIIALGAYAPILHGDEVGQSIPFYRIFRRQLFQTIDDINNQEMAEHMYPDGEPKSIQMRDDRKEMLFSQPSSLQGPPLELVGSIMAAVRVDCQRFLDREEYRFTLTIKSKN